MEKEPALRRKATVELTAGLTHERLLDVLSYSPETGLFTRIMGIPGFSAGTVAGSIETQGYWTVGVDGHYFKGHRLAWFYMMGAWPEHEVDHRDLDRANNIWTNLREATGAEQYQNRRFSNRNTSGFAGVSWNKSNKKWMATISVDNRTKYLGYFPTPEEAHAAYIAAKAIHHPFHSEPAKKVA